MAYLVYLLPRVGGGCMRLGDMEGRLDDARVRGLSYLGGDTHSPTWKEPWPSSSILVSGEPWWAGGGLRAVMPHNMEPRACALGATN